MGDGHVLEADDFASWDEFLDAQGRGYREKLFNLVRSFGADFMEFICAHPAKSPFLDSVPSIPQRTVVSELAQMATDLATIADETQRRVATARKLGRYLDEFETTRTVEWHIRCGGHIPITDDDGTAEAAIKILARDLLGFRLLEPGTHPNVVFDTHPMFHELFARLEDDPLGSIFDNAASDSPNDSHLFENTPRSLALLPLWSDGTCHTIQYHEVVATLITNNVVRRYSPNDVVGEVQAAAIEQLNRARRISSGGRITVPTLVGLVGIKLDDDVEYAGLDGVTIRRSTPLDPGCLNGTTQMWTIAEIDTSFYYIHNQTQNHSISGFENRQIPRREPAHSFAIQELRRKQDDNIDRLRFAVLLTPHVEILSSTAICRTVMNPMTHTAAFLPADLPHNNAAHTITADECMDFEDWLEVVLQMPSHLMHPMRQLLRAAARNDSIDCLLAAVTAWDALLGTFPEGQPPTYVSISHLLEPDDHSIRSTLERELAAIYSIRADIVYGVTAPYDEPLDSAEAKTIADRAVFIAIETFRRILTDDSLRTLAAPRERSLAVLSNE